MDQFCPSLGATPHGGVLVRKREYFAVMSILILLIGSIGYSKIMLPQYSVKEKLYDRFTSDSW